MTKGLLGATPESLPFVAEKTLAGICELLDTDRALLQRIDDDELQVRFSWGRPHLVEPRPQADVWAPMHWALAELRMGRDLALDRLPEGLPPTAIAERAYADRIGLRANLTLPLTVSGRFLWAISTGCFRPRQRWSPDDVERLRHVGNALAAAAERVELELALASRLADLEALQHRLQAEASYLRSERVRERGGDEIIGNTATMLQVMALVDRVAPTTSTVLLLGETGTGKELLARALHARSPRRGGPLVCVNCAAVPASLIESELFGHEKGAFTGASAARLGRVQIASGGTLFLDEVGDLPEEAQIKLLRVLQEREFQPVGSNRTVRVDVRVVAATHRDIEGEAKAGLFRSDLFYRLNVFPIRVPPLRERREDIPLLVWALVERLQGATGKRIRRIRDEDLAALSAYDWPGNVRELQNVVERALILSSGETLAIAEATQIVPGVADPAAIDASAPVARGTNPAPGSRRLDDVERLHIAEVLGSCRGRISGPGGAAEALGLHPNTLRSRMQRLGIRRPTD